MICSTNRVWVVIATLLTGVLPFQAFAQVPGKERVPGGVEYKPPMPGVPQPDAVPSAPAPSKMPAPAMPSPAAGSGGASSAASTAPPANKVTPPPKSSRKKFKRDFGRSQSDGTAKPGEAPSKPIPPGIGGGGDERRPGGVERAPVQPQ